MKISIFDDCIIISYVFLIDFCFLFLQLYDSINKNNIQSDEVFFEGQNASHDLSLGYATDI